MSISIFLPVRNGSERIKNKNTRTFAGIEGGLLKLKLNQLKCLEDVEEIVVSSNDIKCLEIAEELSSTIDKLKIYKRPNTLGNSKTNLEDLIRYVPTITTGSDILWTHVTSPFCNNSDYSFAIRTYNSLDKIDKDSLLSGSNFNEYLLNRETGEIINNMSNYKWPRTQDLMGLFKINNAIFLCPRDQMLEGNRIGKRPHLLNLSKISSLDIDDEEDFKLAEIIYGAINK